MAVSRRRRVPPRIVLGGLVLAGLVACAGGGPAGSPDDGGGDPAPPPAPPSDPSPPTSPPTGAVTEIWVAPDGDDGAGGATRETAFATIDRALGEAGPGALVRVVPGVYREAVALERFGGSEPIVVRGEGGQGSRPVLDGERVRDFALFCDACANLVVEGLEIRGYTDAGILVTSSNRITVRDVYVHDNGFDVVHTEWGLEGYSILVDDNEDIVIEDGRYARNGPERKVQDGVVVLGTGIDTYGNRRVVIRGNVSHENRGGGILVEDSHDVLVEDNEAGGNDGDASADGWWDAGLWVDGGGNVTVRGNTFRDNVGAGLEVSDEDAQSPRGYVLTDNVSTGNDFGIYLWNFGTTDWPDEAVVARSGNVFEGNRRRDVWIEP